MEKHNIVDHRFKLPSILTIFLTLSFLSFAGIFVIHPSKSQCAISINDISFTVRSIDEICLSQKTTININIFLLVNSLRECSGEYIYVYGPSNLLLCKIPIDSARPIVSPIPPIQPAQPIQFIQPTPPESQTYYLASCGFDVERDKIGSIITVYAKYGNQVFRKDLSVGCPAICNLELKGILPEPNTLLAGEEQNLTIRIRYVNPPSKLPCEGVIVVNTPEGNTFCKVKPEPSTWGPGTDITYYKEAFCSGKYVAPSKPGEYRFRAYYGLQEVDKSIFVRKPPCNLVISYFDIKPNRVKVKCDEFIQFKVNATIGYSNAQYCENKTINVYFYSYPGSREVWTPMYGCDAKVTTKEGYTTCEATFTELPGTYKDKEIVPVYAVYKRENGAPIVARTNLEIECEESEIPPPPNLPEEQKQIFELNLKKGWNLVSIPLKNFKIEENNCGIKAIFYYDAEKKEYVKVKIEDLEFGKGYWFNVNSSCKIKVSGDVVNNLDDFPRLYKGWNLIGSLKEKINVYEYRGDCEIKAIFYYDAANKKWVKTNELVPGYGHFIYTANNCKLGEGLPPPPPSGQ